MATVTVTGLEGTLRTILRGIFGVHPTKIDPALYGDQVDAPNPIDWEGYPLAQALADTDATDNEIALQFSAPVSTVERAAPGWSAYSVIVPTGGKCIQVANQNPQRRSIMVINHGYPNISSYGAVIIGPTSNLQPNASYNGSTGLLLVNNFSGITGGGSSPASSVLLPTMGEIWAVCPTDVGGAIGPMLSVVEMVEDGGGRVT